MNNAIECVRRVGMNNAIDYVRRIGMNNAIQNHKKSL
jgi:hypothetical protein